MQITDSFDGGNIVVAQADKADDIRLNIRPDANTDLFQWFFFRVTAAKNQTLKMKIENAGEAAYTKGWDNYEACCSYDLEHWFRVPTQYENGALTIQHTPAHDQVHYAYFAPYSIDRYRRYIARVATDPKVSLTVMGQSVFGQDLDKLTIGEDYAGRKQVWVIARQHPGETMASWWIEGFINRLLDDADPQSRLLLQKARIHIMPLMNPDGAMRGHLRTNANGIDLNREWQEPSMENSPEVFLTRDAMRQTGVSFMLDVHGDEALPYNFIASPFGIPSWDQRKEKGHTLFTETLKSVNPDFQTEHGYPRSQPGKGNLKICSNHVAEFFNCYAGTLEMPFKDAAQHPMPETGWSPERSKKLGASCVDAILAAIAAI